jgi:hypothetical protein
MKELAVDHVRGYRARFELIQAELAGSFRLPNGRTVQNEVVRMLVEKLASILPIRSGLGKLLVGSALSALVISLGMVGVCWLLALPIHGGVAAALGAIGGGIYAARYYRDTKKPDGGQS